MLLPRLTHSTTGRLPDLRPDLLQVEVVPQAEEEDGSAHLSLTPSSVDLEEVLVDSNLVALGSAALRDG